MPQGQKAEEFKLEKGLDALISLNISHLHDAANFFALLKNQIEAGEDLNQIKKFSRGAAYHFRALFEELRSSKESLNENNIRLNNIEHLERYYSKEAIDLKDVLELEILHLDQRLVFKDESHSKHAMTRANFGLLSKLMINLIENALKYSEKSVELELKDLGKDWGLRISSQESSIPENIASNLEASLGHGLSASADIMRFHQGEIEIYSLENEGACVSLKFKKFTEQNKTTPIKKNYHKSNNFNSLIISSLFILCISALTLLTTNDSAIKQETKHRLELIDENQANEYRTKLFEIKDQYLNKTTFALKTSNLASYSILIALPNKNTSRTWRQEAEHLLTKIPEAYDLRLGLAGNYMHHNLTARAIAELVLAFYYYLNNQNQELKIARATITVKGPEYYLASIKEPILDKPKVQIITKPQKTNTKEEIKDENFDALNKLIEEQNQDLGINLDL